MEDGNHALAEPVITDLAEEEIAISPDALAPIIAHQTDEFIFLCLGAAEAAPGAAGVPHAILSGAMAAFVRYALLHSPPDIPIKHIRRALRRSMESAVQRVRDDLANATVVPDPGDMDLPDGPEGAPLDTEETPV